MIVDFVPEGLDGRWPSRWLDFLEGPSTGPFYGVFLGHASTSATIYVCTYPRSRFEAEMTPPTDGDPLRELAFNSVHHMINRVIAQVGLAGTQRDSLTRLLTQYSNSRATEYQAWGTVKWHVTTAESAAEEIDARTTSLADWQAGFAVAGDIYVSVASYGIALDNISLVPVFDSTVYGFSFDDARLPQHAASAVPGSDIRATLHNDLANLMAGEL